MPPPLSPPTPATIIPTRHALALANSQRLIASWLPPPTATEIPPPGPATTETEEPELFTPAPERLGFGAVAGKDDGDGEGGADMKRIERLRRQLLGGGGGRRTRNGKVSGKRERRGDGIRTVAGTGGRKIHPTARKRAGHDGDSESEDEEGRSSVGKSKSSGALKRGKELGAGSVHDANDDANDGVVVGGELEMRDAGEGLKRRLRGSERAGNYLDEVLADRALKRRKKRRKRGGVVEG